LSKWIEQVYHVCGSADPTVPVADTSSSDNPTTSVSDEPNPAKDDNNTSTNASSKKQKAKSAELEELFYDN